MVLGVPARDGLAMTEYRTMLIKMMDVVFHLAYGFQTKVQWFEPMAMTMSERETGAWRLGRRIGTVTLQALARLA